MQGLLTDSNDGEPVLELGQVIAGEAWSIGGALHVESERRRFADKHIAWARVTAPGDTVPQRVVQSCVGGEHGVLLTDAGLVFTWGDNRYGQLGRTVSQLEEQNVPYIVSELSDQEVVQVSCGKNHTAALTATHKLYCWGRNKKGQLGDAKGIRDSVKPNQLVIVRANAEQERFSAVSCGDHSTIAVSMGGQVYLWGAALESIYAKKMNTPDKVCELGTLPRPRVPGEWKKPTVDVGFLKVLPEQQEKEGTVKKDRDYLSRQIADFASNIASTQDSIGKIKDAAAGEADGPAVGGADKAEEDEGDLGIVEPAATLTAIQRQVQQLKNSRVTAERSKASADIKLTHIRTQLSLLESQAIHLTREVDTILQQQAQSRGHMPVAEKRRLESRLANLREFQEANQNTRMTLMDERAVIEKERAASRKSIEQADADLKNREKRQKVITDLAQQNAGSAGQTDANPILESGRLFCHDISRTQMEVEKLHKDKDKVPDYRSAKDKLVKAEHETHIIEEKLHELEAVPGGEVGGLEIAFVKELVGDLLALRRDLIHYYQQRLMTLDADCDPFFAVAKPKT
mmetsp:Transcript_13343/g.29671  ORF Transcript_13343/g.29671 Transcript_13343/m.29671 type:complete len:572 (+) Transcript_13343:30-1745(+)|eukprot:CAMPEP_0204354802 /NCGR_PEP_ID=MMETSP0469-20131031/33664_1 /ASSEMBLY_ACC=CAM_ASM_000384 /TAXON_ID=2969 /ORGANISM="Oxyrrhis marina" /LENGTH=571 /DNA_ID=CAMNT_0051341959 /DNA_START=27 /DNA_END=1742 /DNA_ORIENTATION=+